MSRVFAPVTPWQVEQAISQGLWTKQLSLLADQVIEQSESLECRLSIELVPQDVQLDSKPRFWIVVRQYDLAWHYPLQFYREELNALLPHLRGINWKLNESEGYPVETPFIHTQIEYLIDEWLPTQKRQQRRTAA